MLGRRGWHVPFASLAGPRCWTSLATRGVIVSGKPARNADDDLHLHTQHEFLIGRPQESALCSETSAYFCSTAHRAYPRGIHKLKLLPVAAARQPADCSADSSSASHGKCHHTTNHHRDSVNMSALSASLARRRQPE